MILTYPRSFFASQLNQGVRTLELGQDDSGKSKDSTDNELLERHNASRKELKIKKYIFLKNLELCIIDGKNIKISLTNFKRMTDFLSNILKPQIKHVASLNFKVIN